MFISVSSMLRDCQYLQRFISELQPINSTSRYFSTRSTRTRFKSVQIVAFYFHKPLWNKQQVAYFGVCVFGTAYIPLGTFVRPNQNLKCTKCNNMPLERVRMLIWTNRLATIVSYMIQLVHNIIATTVLFFLMISEQKWSQNKWPSLLQP